MKIYSKMFETVHEILCEINDDKEPIVVVFQGPISGCAMSPGISAFCL